MNQTIRHIILGCLVLLFNITGLHATHIVGGEFEIQEKRGGLYDIFLNLYFDAVNGNEDAIDNPVEVVIFDKATNTIQDQLQLTLIYDSIVPYENPDCAIDELSIRLLRYKTSGTFQFDQMRYNDPQGYYIVYDRCCRNNIITNIVAPEKTGMLFYLHFPPIYQPDGSLTGYSSPVFNLIKTRYACLDEYFYMDFGATDADGDSLVYKMVKPLKGYTDDTNPILNTLDYRPEPYPAVIWGLGYSANNAIHGAPSLYVDSTNGILKVTASDSGLFVFSVMVEEYRDGVKIGEVRRDFQIVVAPCDPNDPPSVLMAVDDTSGFYQEGDTVYIANDDDRCFDFFITDDQDPRNNERISIEVLPVNFSSSADFGLDDQVGFVGGLGDTLTGLQMCWPICEYLLDEPYVVDIAVYDDGCILPKSDTIRLIVEVEPDSNEAPSLFWNYKGNTGNSDSTLTVSVFVDSLLEIDFTGTDPDLNDQLIITADAQAFSFTQTGMNWRDVTGTNGIVNGTFRWQPDCNVFETGRNEYPVYFMLRDNSCYPDLQEDSVLVVINLEQLPTEVEKFIPANIFTPNGDGENDLFRMPTLPNGTCGDKFVAFEVYNRWGRKVFGDDSRDFAWDGSDAPAGMYFYIARFEQTVYKGYFQVAR